MIFLLKKAAAGFSEIRNIEFPLSDLRPFRDPSAVQPVLRQRANPAAPGRDESFQAETPRIHVAEEAA